jgi:ABC-type cobalamin/Fe3+-siderophores transport system ATPase subunit
MLNNGKVSAAGKPEEVLTFQNILTVYGTPTIIFKERSLIRFLWLPFNPFIHGYS